MCIAGILMSPKMFLEATENLKSVIIMPQFFADYHKAGGGTR
jgi:hypothetical protein